MRALGFKQTLAAKKTESQDLKEVVAFDSSLHRSHLSHNHHRNNHLHHNEKFLETEVVIEQPFIELTIDFSSFAVPLS